MCLTSNLVERPMWSEICLIVTHMRCYLAKLSPMNLGKSGEPIRDQNCGVSIDQKSGLSRRTQKVREASSSRNKYLHRSLPVIELWIQDQCVD
jgi:hypothetical protein